MSLTTLHEATLILLERTGVVITEVPYQVN